MTAQDSIAMKLISLPLMKTLLPRTQPSSVLTATEAKFKATNLGKQILEPVALGTTPLILTNP
jgi:hypothetical protein